MSREKIERSTRTCKQYETQKDEQRCEKGSLRHWKGLPKETSL